MKPNTASQEAFDRLVSPRLGNLCRTALWVVGSEAEARGLVQETFVSAYCAWREGRLASDNRIGLFRILSSVLFNRDRSFSTRSTAANDRDVIDRPKMRSRPVNQRPVDEPGRKPCLTVSGEDLRNAIQRVPRDLRLTVVLSLAEGFSCQEIADITGSQIEAARARLHQGRRLLQRELLGNGDCDSSTILKIGGVNRSQIG